MKLLDAFPYSTLEFLAERLFAFASGDFFFGWFRYLASVAEKDKQEGDKVKIS